MLSSAAFAQQNEEEEQMEEIIELRQLGLLNGQILTEDEGTTININELIRQREYGLVLPDGSPALGNQSVVIQKGNYNESYWLQIGDKNSFGLIQDGDKNIYNGKLNGDENLIRVLQLGNNNNVFQDLEGRNMKLDIIQEGNNHEVIQIEKDGTSPAYQIHQQGEHGMTIFIEHLSN